MSYDAYTGEELSDSDLEDRFDDMLDEVHGDVEIAGMTFSTSRALKELDPVAYRCSLADWESAEIEEGNLTEEPPADEEDEDDDE